MMTSISSSTKKIFSISLLVAVLVLMVVVFVFIELFNRTALYQENLSLLADGVERQKDVDRVQRIIIESQEERDRLSDYTLTVMEAVNFLETIERYASNSQIDVTIGQLEVVEDGRMQTEMLSIPYQLEGTQKNILDFLFLMESLPYFSYVESFSMSTNERITPRYNATLQLRVKYNES